MLGRIGKSYPRVQPAANDPAPRRHARRYGALGGLIALLSALGWRLFR